jgi:Ca2+-binding RTX toxin-like protein
MNGNFLVDGIEVDGGAGNDSIYSSAALLAPVLVTIQGGVGFDDLRTGTGVMGLNPVRVTIHAGAIDIYSDTIQLFQGRNKVIGSVNDVILVSGSALHDTVALSQTLEGTVFSINGVLASTNDLSEFEGVIHVDLLGGNDSATLVGYSIPTSVMGGDGNDLVNAEGLLATVSISGGSGNDTLRGSAFADEISGDSGNDDIYAGTGDDTLTGGDGNDDFFWFAGDGLDLIDGGTGDDWAGFAGSTTADNAFTLTPLTSSTPSTAPGLGSGDSNRVLVSYSSAQASHMSDVEAVSLNGGGGCDSYGIGNLQTTDLRVVDVAFSTTAMGGVVSTYATNLPDTITVTADAPNQIGVNGLAVPVRIFNANPATAIVVHAGFGTDTIEVDPVAETQAIIVIDGGSGNDTITGGSIIIGGNGNNLLIGTDNPNTIVGGTGSDTIQGLGGSDLLFGDALVTGLDQPGPNCDYLAGLVITPTATGAGDLIEGGEGDDSINGNVGADSLFGGLGNDDIGELTYKGVFFPESGNDAIDGGDGNNCVFSGEGDDSVVVGSGNNLLVLGAGNNTAVTGNGNNTIFAGSGNDTVTTGSGNDVVILGAGNDTAKLGSGNDLAWGEAGNDFIVGALGNDTIYGGSGNDTLWGGTQATKEVKNSSKVVTTPNDGNDVLAGEDGFDKLDGGTANNIMDAGADNIRETMIGSGGWDTAYIHANEGKNQDVLKNHTSRYTLIPYGSMPIAMVPATPTNCDTPITVIIPNPLSGKLAKAPAKPKALPKATGFFTRKPAVK